MLVNLAFAVLPESRTADDDQIMAIFAMQTVLAWINVVISVGLVLLVWNTYSVTQRELTFERQSRVGYLIVFKVGQILLAIAMLAYPTFTRNLLGACAAFLALIEIAYGLYVVRESRDTYTRRVRPPLVIKALLDMKGEALGETNRAQPLTLGMLERLEGIVKVRDQMKFNVHQGREYLIVGVFVLLFFSFAQFMWEFTKVLTYQNRFFTKRQAAEIASASNLHMYWPAVAYDAATSAPSATWQYHPGGAGCQASGSCRFPRDGANSRLTPVPNGDQRVVLVVMSGLHAASEFTKYLSFRKRPGWAADGLELLMEAQLPTNAVPNWSALLTGATPDLTGILGNRNLGTTAYDNVFRMMRRFQDRWYCDLHGLSGGGGGAAIPECAGGAAGSDFTTR